jgi:pimeloyl-ACP methyl ester carboxylesterase
MGRVEVDGVGIEYQVTGQGRPVVLLHGFPDTGRLWRHQVPALAEAGFRVIVPDLRVSFDHGGVPLVHEPRVSVTSR